MRREVAQPHARNPVFGATRNKTGSFPSEATKGGADTLLSHIVQLVEGAQNWPWAPCSIAFENEPAEAKPKAGPVFASGSE